MSYRSAFVFLLLVQALYFGPVLFHSEAIYPHDNAFEVGAAEAGGGDPKRSNRNFSDQSSAFIPEINHHLNGRYRWWLSTWNPSTQLGHPSVHLGGLSKAYVLTHLLSLLTKDPFVLYSWFTVLTVVLTGVFLFFLLQALGLHPVACASAALGLALGGWVSYWLTFAVFLSVICWTSCLLWLVIRFVNRQTYPLALGIAFASYSLLMTGYPQSIILQSYLVCGYTLILLRKSPGPTRAKLLVGIKLLTAAVIGAAMTIPVYLDLLITAQRSARFEFGAASFLAALPHIEGLRDLGLFFSSVFDPFWFGNPIQLEYPKVFDGLSYTPLYCSLPLLTLFHGQWRRLWLWQVFTFACFIATIWPSAYLFAVNYLGFHLSASRMIGGTLIPVFILSGYAADRILREGFRYSVVVNAIVFLPFLLACALYFLFPNPDSGRINVSYVVLSGALGVGTYLFATTRRRFLLLLLTIVTVFSYGYQLQLFRPRTDIQTSSDILELMKSKTKDGSRIAFVGRKIIVPPNQESLLGIRSIHAYDSLSSKNYHGFVNQFSEQVYRHIQLFVSIPTVAKATDAAVSYAGIGLFVAWDPLPPAHFRMVGQSAGYKCYRGKYPPVLVAQLARFSVKDGQAVVNGPLKTRAGLNVDHVRAFDDFHTFKLTSLDQPTLLFVSQQYHPQWVAKSGERFLDSVVINGFYQGVVLPPNVEAVTLEFRPYARWMWLPQVFFAVFGLMLWLNNKMRT